MNQPTTPSICDRINSARTKDEVIRIKAEASTFQFTSKQTKSKWERLTSQTLARINSKH